jgi:FMN phosphatase YigB (HAD superfamily)
MEQMKLSYFKVLTFDTYGTLIDWEAGIYNGLAPLVEGPAWTAGLVTRSSPPSRSTNPTSKYRPRGWSTCSCYR